jgi:hypothetical protein
LGAVKNQKTQIVIADYLVVFAVALKIIALKIAGV